MAPAIGTLLLVLRAVLPATEEFGAQQLAHLEVAEEEEDGKTECSYAKYVTHRLKCPFWPF